MTTKLQIFTNIRRRRNACTILSLFLPRIEPSLSDNRWWVPDQVSSSRSTCKPHLDSAKALKVGKSSPSRLGIVIIVANCPSSTAFHPLAPKILREIRQEPSLTLSLSLSDQVGGLHRFRERTFSTCLAPLANYFASTFPSSVPASDTHLSLSLYPFLQRE